MFDSILGLPLHPLVVHAVVVLLPLAALGVIALTVVPRWRQRYAALVLIALVVATGSAFVAKESGEALARVVGEPGDHGEWGDLVPIAAFALLVVGGAWLATVMWGGRSGRRGATSAAIASSSGAEGEAAPARDRAPKSQRSGLGSTLFGAAASLVALAVLGVTMAAGHTGAKAAWSEVDMSKTGSTASPSVSPSPSVSASASASGSASPSASASGSASAPSASPTEATYTMAQVAKHATSSSCWSAINGSVYDLTQWLSQHPGGASPIRSICGRDGSTAFNQRLANTAEAQDTLPHFKIGTLAP